MDTQPDMARKRTRLGRSLSLAALALLGSAYALALPGLPDRGQRERLARVTPSFVENKGQLPGDVRFSTSTFFGTVLVGHDGRLTYSLPKAQSRLEPSQAIRQAAGAKLTETLVGATPLPTAGARAPGNVSYLVGNDPRRWQNDLPTYEEVRLGRVWPGVSMVLRAHGRNVEKVFTLQPGARVGQIRMRVDGVGPLAIDPDGALVAATGSGEIRFTKPVAYQEQDGLRRPVAAAYALHGSTYGFRVGAYDHAAPLVIDPVLQSTYIGGADPDSLNAIAIDPSSGEVLVAGYSYSTSGRGVDGLVARFDPTLTTLLHSTYIGGSGGEEIFGIAVNPVSGDVYVAGFTSSADFPAAILGAQRGNAGSDDGFVARLDPTLTQLLRATYLGGSDLDRIVAIAIHPGTGEVYVAGQTISPDFPGTAGGAQPSPSADGDFLRRDGFVARLDPTLGTLLQATYLGGNGPEFLHCLAIHPASGEIYVAGQTRAPDFPGAAGGALAATYPFTGNTDGFIARFDPSLTSLLQSTYVGASGYDDIFGIAIHPVSGEVYAVGWSDWVDLPGIESGAQSVMGGETDAFVTRLDRTLTKLLGATYLGGGGNDYGYAIAVHPTSGDVYVTGETYSTNFPGVARGDQPERGDGVDGFVARLDPKLTHLVQTTYLGGGGDDIPSAIAVQPGSGEVIVAGMTTSPDFPGAAGSSQPGYAGGDEFFGGDGFVTRLPAGLSGAGSVCVGNTTTLCLNGHRFAVSVDWRVPSQNKSGVGTAVPLGADTGYFWFFNDANAELVVKILDGRAVNGHTWVFSGALTNVEYTIKVTDTDTGEVKVYANPSGTLRSFADTAAFEDSPGSAGAETAASPELERQMDARSATELYAMYAALTEAITPDAATAGPCEPGGATLCLNHARFQVSVDWAVPGQNKSGHGTAVAVTADTGYFWFFKSTNVELMVKVLDGRGVNGKYWVLYGALSNVQYTITVTDTETGTVQKYDNASGTLASVADTSAF